jgi:hypothetical protein
MSIYFPTYDFTGIRPSRWNAQPPDWDAVTDVVEYADGGKDYDEVADNPPRRWEYEHTGLTQAQGEIFVDFYNSVRKSQPFYFIDKFGDVWSDVRIESFERNHDAHKSWVKFVRFVLVSDVTTQIVTGGEPPPTGFELIESGGSV